MLRDELLSWLRSCHRLVIMGIGNPLRGDDGAAVYMIRLMRRRTPKRVQLLSCGSSPENFLGRIERLRPTHVLMIDAAQLGLEPGRAMLVPPERIVGLTLSTHMVPLSTLAQFVAERTGASQMLLGIQPKAMDYGIGLSKELRVACRELANMLLDVLERSC